MLTLVLENAMWSQPMICGIPPSPRSYHSACTVCNRIYVFGGYDGTTRSEELFILEEGSVTRSQHLTLIQYYRAYLIFAFLIL